MGNSETQLVPVNRFGLTEVHSSRPADVDVVFVHGLNGDPHNTWTSTKSKVFWPAQLLPPLLEEEHARILVYGYDADITSFTDGVSKDKIHNHAEHLVAELAANRRIRKATERPIVFVAHSLGGLVVKRALIYSSEIRGTKTEHLRSIFVSTYGILFLGTPHKGADVAKWGSRLEWIAGAVMPQNSTASQLVDALKTNNETLQNIDRSFMQLMSKFHIYFFHEAKPTVLKGSNVSRFIVDEDSASPTVQDVERAGIQADHSHICKFENEDSPGFDLVAEGIQRYAGDAPSTVKGRWESEKEEQIRRRKETIEELLPTLPDSLKGTSKTASTNTSAGNSAVNLSLPPRPETRDDGTNTESPTKPTDPYFIVPPGFRANTYFVGMEKELQQIDRHLFDKRRQDGTACVLVHGQPGGGKSHLARQYVNKNRKKFSGGIFWILAKIREERYQAFWNIYTKVVARDAPELYTRATGDEFVDTVKAWFESRQEWLIVFDGLVIEKDEEATEFTRFVPDSRNSSIIYASRAKNLESKQRLLRPYPIKVPSLKEEDARKLLFKELHMKKPTEADVKSATEWVRKVGGLPLAIDALSHRLVDTHEPLTKVNIKSFSADSKLGTTYNSILEGLLRLGHREAWNLINLLSFLGQHVPVEMVHLGLRSLRYDNIDVKSRENGGKPDINITFKILMRYALIERNEPDDKDSKSSSRDSLVEPEPIDMLKLHSVVQKFCCDSLNGKKELPKWLGYAVGLFTCSYDQADRRIKQKPEPGRVSDYREYQIHGKRLWENSITYETKTQPLKSIRAKLEPVLESIAAEIRLREPGSSQESVGKGVFQISIFDRTTSSSESAESEGQTPDPPYPLKMPYENNWGMDGSRSSVDSPASYGTDSPQYEPRIVSGSPTPQGPALFHDIGYDSDREGPDSHPMQKDWSEATARPRAPTLNSQSEGWQVVAANKRGRKKGGRRDLGSFRPTPAKATVDKGVATGSIWATQGPTSALSRPDAFRSLSEVQHRSPPPSRDGDSFWRRLSPARASNPNPTYAGVVAGQLQRPTSSHPFVSSDQSSPLAPQTSSPSASLGSERGRSSGALRSRAGNIQRSPPQPSDYPPPGHVTYSPDNNTRFSSPSSGHASPGTHAARPPSSGLQYVTGPGSDTSEASQPRYINESFTYVPPPPIIGTNPAPLPLEEVTITSKRRLPSDFQTDPPPVYPSPRSIPISPLQQTPLYPTVIPAGYYSQPMSREGSRQSRDSAAETEPVRYSSQISPSWNVSSFGSPRSRLADGRPLRKSPKSSTHAFPAVLEDVSPDSSTEHLASGAGGWAYPTSPVPSNPVDMATSMSMSRSSSGPGIALDSTSTTNALGIASAGVAPAAVGVVHYSLPVVQFGEHSPISVEEARQRTWEHEQRLRREREVLQMRQRMKEADEQRLRMRRSEDLVGGAGNTRGRGRVPPYPDVDLMPNDYPAVVTYDAAGRRRGYSAPESPGVQVRAGMDF